MTELKNAWWTMMVNKYGSEEAVREFMRENQRRSMLNPNNQKGNKHAGFSDPEVARQASLKGWAKRRAKAKAE